MIVLAALTVGLRLLISRPRWTGDGITTRPTSDRLAVDPVTLTPAVPVNEAARRRADIRLSLAGPSFLAGPTAAAVLRAGSALGPPATLMR
ncbi:hypothetical protein ACGFJ7_12295 [Actinoplanes sp. NPDC048988]|uniref:hypothetical protein n=1 Tax=Actinoplanes sp. NPDC048988 TaxID=3363901 RepID=UPI00371BDB88